MGVLKGTTTTIGVIPFTELYERLLNLGRIDSPNNRDYAKGITNDTYTRSLPRLEDWDVIIKTDYLTMVPTEKTGTVSVTVGSTSVTGTGTAFTAAMTAASGYKISFSGNRDIYLFDYVSATSGTITPALSGPNDLTDRNFKIFKDEYDLAADFDRFLKNGSVYVYSDARVQDVIKEVPRDMFQEELENAERDPIRRVLRTGINTTTGRRMVRVNPYPKERRVYPYEYFYKIPPMSEYLTGTIQVVNGSTTVEGTDTFWSTNVSAGDWLRVDANGVAESSVWYKIASITDDDTLELETAFGEFGESNLEYTICESPDAFPSEFHEFIIYDALQVVGFEQGDANSVGFTARREEILADLKKNYKARRTNTQFRVGDDGIRSGRYNRDDDVSYRR
jgi:hypothetical protein